MDCVIFSLSLRDESYIVPNTYGIPTLVEKMIYIGSSQNKKEILDYHLIRCFGKNKSNCWHSNLYKKISESGITKETFKEKVKVHILFENVPYENLFEVKRLTIKIYRTLGHPILSIKSNLPPTL